VAENGIAKLKTVTAGRILGQSRNPKRTSDGESVIVTGQINLQDGNKSGYNKINDEFKILNSFHDL
jgi:hypothetical protein